MFMPSIKLGFLALIATIILNTLSLHFLRSVASSAILGLWVLALAYLPMSLVFFALRKASRRGGLKDWMWILTWSASVSSIYLLFLVFPQSISVAQLIIAQSAAPIAAVFLTGDFKKSGNESWLRLAPLGVLILLAYLQKGGANFNAFAFGGLCFAFLMVQAAMRELSKLESPSWVLPRFSLITSALLGTLVIGFEGGEAVSIDGPLLAFSVVLMSCALLLTQAGYLYGLSKTPAFLSAIGLSSSVPVAILIGLVLSSRATVDWLQIGLSISYCICIGFIALRSNSKDRPQAHDEEEVPLREKLPESA